MEEDVRAFVSIIMFSAIAGTEVASAEIPKARPYADQRTKVVERESIRERYLTRMKMERRMVYVPDDGSIAQPWWKSILPRIGPRSGWRREWQDVLVPVTEVDRIPVSETVRTAIVRLGFRDRDGNRIEPRQRDRFAGNRRTSGQSIGGVSRFDDNEEVLHR